MPIFGPLPAGELYESSGPAVLPLGAIGDGQALVRSGATIIGAAASGAVPGTATIPFASWLSEDSVTVVDPTVGPDSTIIATIIAETDDVYAQDWNGPVIRNVSTGTFDVMLRPQQGTFRGSIRVRYLRTA